MKLEREYHYQIQGNTFLKRVRKGGIQDHRNSEKGDKNISNTLVPLIVLAVTLSLFLLITLSNLPKA